MYGTLSYPFWLTSYEEKTHTNLAPVLSILKDTIVMRTYCKL